MARYDGAMMTLRPALVLLLALATADPVAAQEAGAAPDDGSAREGMGLIEKGARMVLDSFLADVGPKLEDMQDGLAEAMAQAEPVLRELLAKVDDIRNYHAPEILPNGDILIRRKTPEELAVPPSDEIEL